MMSCIKRWGLICLIAALGSACALAVWFRHYPLQPIHLPPPPLEHDIKPELFCNIPLAPQDEIAEALATPKPCIYLREYSDGEYELLFRANPIREAYTFSATNVNTGQSILLNEAGQREKWRDMTMSNPKRTDGKLPLQPAVKLHRIQGKHGRYYAVKFTVHDAQTGVPLCSDVYLINGNSEKADVELGLD